MNTIDFADKSDITFLLENSIFSKKVLQNKIDNKEIIIAKIGETQVGFLIIDYLWGHLPFISFIKVLNDHQRKSIGRSLLKFLERFLKDSGKSVLISSSMETNTNAQTWHRKMGFVDSGFIENINEKDVDEVFFRKLLC